MKHALLKFVISNALNRGRPLSPFWRKLAETSPDAAAFERRAAELDRRLRQPAHADAAPAGLHAGIMRAVREDHAELIRTPQAPLASSLTPVLRWTCATAAVALLGLALWVALRPSGGQGSRVLPAPELVRRTETAPLPCISPLVEQLASNSVAILGAPVNRQIEDLSRDLRETAQFLLASLP